MNKKKIKEYYNKYFKEENERVVDIEVIEPYGYYVDIITITKNHIVWLNKFEIINKKLKFLDTKCLS